MDQGLSMARDDDSVGYGRPPKATRFAKGTSGNPSGRPRGSRDLRADLQDELAELISVNDEAGGPQRITKQRALVKAIVQKALSGDVRAVNALFALTVRGNGQETDELAGAKRMMMRLWRNTSPTQMRSTRHETGNQSPLPSEIRGFCTKNPPIARRFL